jgi:hypothetical protein
MHAWNKIVSLLTVFNDFSHEQQYDRPLFLPYTDDNNKNAVTSHLPKGAETMLLCRRLQTYAIRVRRRVSSPGPGGDEGLRSRDVKEMARYLAIVSGYGRKPGNLDNFTTTASLGT